MSVKAQPRGVCEVHVPPHGVGDAHRSTEERREAEERDEDGGHLADAVGFPRGLAVPHHAALWAEGTLDEVMIVLRAYIHVITFLLGTFLI